MGNKPITTMTEDHSLLHTQQVAGLQGLPLGTEVAAGSTQFTLCV